MRNLKHFKVAFAQKIAAIQKSISGLTPAQFYYLAGAIPEKLILIDVREETEANTFPFPLRHIQRSFLEMKCDLEADRPEWLTPEKYLILLCDTEWQSALAANKLHKMGYPVATYVIGGLTALKKASPDNKHPLDIETFTQKNQTALSLVDQLAYAHLQVQPIELEEISHTHLQSYQFIDLRSHSEIQTTGHIPNAWLLPRGILEQGLTELTHRQKDIFETDIPLILYCAKDPRAMLAYTTLQELGITHCRPLRGGFEKWQREQYPITLL